MTAGEVRPFALRVTWVSALEQAGHLDAFVARLIGASMPAGATQTDNVSDATRAAEAAYIAAHPFRPTRAILPDDFLLLRRDL